MCPKLGQEINTDELGELIQDAVKPIRVEKKYPLALIMPPISSGSYTDKSGDWDDYRVTLFFLTPAHYSGTNQIINPNPNTNTSTHTVVQTWHDMKRVAINFIRTLSQVQRSLSLVSSSFRLDQGKDTVITPVSNIGQDKISGVRLDFGVSVYIDCGIEDYTKEGIAAITINQDDSHPEHNL